MAKFEVEIDSIEDLVRVTVTGPFAVEDADRLTAAIISAPGFVPGMDALIDSRMATTDFSAVESRMALEGITYPPERGTGFRTANVVSSDVDFGMARAVHAIGEQDRPFAFRVFRDVDSALAWIRSGKATSSKN